MAKKLVIKCVVCDKSDNFSDSKDVTQARWKIIGWNIGQDEPICTCNKCDYFDQPKKQAKSSVDKTKKAAKITT